MPIRPAAGKRKVFGVVGLSIFTFSFLANVNTTPQLATFGLGAVIIFLGAIFLFLAPTAMTSAEMGSAWPHTGGIYVWTRMAFGEGPGFMVIWLEWANFVVAWPGMMGTLLLQTSYAINPELNGNPVFVVVIVICVTWLAALAGLRGLRVTKGFAWWSVVAGTVIPALLLVGFAVAWLLQGNPSNMELGWDQVLPDISFSNLGFISGSLLMFSGIEIAANHAGDVRDPGKTIPRSNFVAVLLCFLLFAPLTLALAIVIPGDIDIVAGLVQAGDSVFDQFGMHWLTYVLTFLVVTGLIAALVQILNGPSRGLMVAGREGGNLPPFLQRENKRKMPVAIILSQAAISSVLALGYSFLGSIENAWFMFALMQTNMTLIMYTLMFASVIKLRRLKPDQERPYRVPGKKVGLYACTGIGALVCVFGILISLVPTDEAEDMPALGYVAVIALGTAAFVALPFVFRLFRKPSWTRNEAGLEVDAEAL